MKPRIEKKPPEVLDPHTQPHFVYDPKKGHTASMRAAQEARRKRIKEMLQPVKINELKAGDVIYIKLTRHEGRSEGERVIFSGYHSAYYLHKIVEHEGILYAENLTRTPAAPAASRAWHREGNRIPLRAMDENSLYKLKKKK